MSEPVPYRIYLHPETIEELIDAAAEVGKESGNKVAASVVTDCLQVWIALQKSLAHHQVDFLNRLVAEIETKKKT